jgi:hypothetical protein
VIPGEYWCVVTWNGCSSDTSVHFVLPTSVINPSVTEIHFNVFPVPNDGRFTVSISSPISGSYNIKVYNNLGVIVSRMDDIEVNGLVEKQLDLRPIPEGMYTVMIENGTQRATKKIIITR